MMLKCQHIRYINQKSDEDFKDILLLLYNTLDAQCKSVTSGSSSGYIKKKKL